MTITLAPTYWLQPGARVQDSCFVLGAGEVIEVRGMGDHATAVVKLDTMPNHPVLMLHKDLELE